MKLNKVDQKAYPRLAHYLRHKVPQLINVGPVVYNLHKHGLLTRSEAKKALSWGEAPIVKVVDLSVTTCGPVPAAYGCTRNASEIEVDIKVVQDFEKGAANATNANKAGGKVYMLGVTLLHELCHWSHNVKGVPEKGHAGNDFEVGAYGKIVG
jgi:hypothetical protein